jgi:hypothetical protein
MNAEGRILCREAGRSGNANAVKVSHKDTVGWISEAHLCPLGVSSARLPDALRLSGLRNALI